MIKERLKKFWSWFRYHTLPRGCFYCELLGLCRDEENGWKCHNGCMVLNDEIEARKEAKL